MGGGGWWGRDFLHMTTAEKISDTFSEPEENNVTQGKML